MTSLGDENPHGAGSRTSSAVGAALLAVGFSLAGLGCGAQAPERELVVFAASSLQEAFAELARDFEGRAPGWRVRLSLAGSQVLRLQIEQGAAADVFASANAAHMGALRAAGQVADSRVFAHNELALIVPPDNPAAIRRFEDLPAAQRIVVGSERVPVGDYTRRLLERAEAHFGAPFVAAVRQRIVSREPNVRLVRAKVELGEADAAVVYRTDAAAGAGRLREVPIPAAINVRAAYTIAPLARSPRRALAERFVEYVLSAAGRARLARHGFLPEEPS